MAKKTDKKAEQKPIVFTAEDKTKYLIKGKTFFFKGEKYTAEKAVQNKDLMKRLIEIKAPSIEKI